MRRFNRNRELKCPCGNIFTVDLLQGEYHTAEYECQCGSVWRIGTIDVTKIKSSFVDFAKMTERKDIDEVLNYKEIPESALKLIEKLKDKYSKEYSFDVLFFNLYGIERIDLQFSKFKSINFITLKLEIFSEMEDLEIIKKIKYFEEIVDFHLLNTDKDLGREFEFSEIEEMKKVVYREYII